MNEKLGVSTVLGLYGLVVSACYLMAYWGAFGIDIFQLAGLTDFVKLAIFPVALVAISGAVVMLASSLAVPFMPDYERIFSQPRNGKVLRAGALFSMIVIGLLLTFVHGDWKWAAGFSLGVFPVIYVCMHPKARTSVPNGGFRFIAAMFLLIMPLMVAFSGSRKAEVVKEGKAQRVVDNTGVAAGLIATPEHPLMYIGFVSETFVIYETQTRSVVLLKQVDNAPLVLKPNPKAFDVARASWGEILGFNRHDQP